MSPQRSAPADDTTTQKMDFIIENLLTFLILLPTFGALAVIGHSLFWNQTEHLKWLTLTLTGANFLYSLLLFGGGGLTENGFTFVRNVPWIEAINSNYHVGLDGLSIWLVILTTFIMPIAVLSTWDTIKKHHTGFLCFPFVA